MTGSASSVYAGWMSSKRRRLRGNATDKTAKASVRVRNCRGFFFYYEVSTERELLLGVRT